MKTYYKPVSFSAFVTLLLLMLFGCDPTEITPPNILWIVSEDNGPFLGCYGDSLATTPNLDKLAERGIRYTNAYANAPVCAPARATIITGMYPITLGLENMRSKYGIPDFVKFFPRYLRELGYYTTNRSKKDYNTKDQPEAWDESSKSADYNNRNPGQPFFHIVNLMTTHESRLHRDSVAKDHDPTQVNIPPYHPDTKEVRNDWAVYYDRMSEMDSQVGKILQKLNTDGVEDNTIVFYYSDHGGALPRSKRFLFESGLKIPMIVHIPEMYKSLAPQVMGTTSEDMVSFIDLAPTVLSLAGMQVPDHMQGRSFLGKKVNPPRPYNYAFRGRMDERIDVSRSITDGRYRYTRNYMPHRPYAQYIGYLWRAPSMRSWQDQFELGQLNAVQDAFFRPKPFEELYDLNTDPHNVINLAENSDFRVTKEGLSEALDQWQIEVKDAGLVPESMIVDLTQYGTIYENISKTDNIAERLQVAKLSASGDNENLNRLVSLIDSDDAVIRYWAAVGLTILGDEAAQAKPILKAHLKDQSVPVGIASAEALYYVGEKDLALRYLLKQLHDDREMVRLQVLNVLDMIGEDGRLSLPIINDLIRDREDRAYDNRAMWSMVEKFDARDESFGD
ncbi:MAG: sulfatase-like hydrolase/transferase [Cyclobacteriaceae bacterium]|nr:sulfatase-like hydrolase/transferase [Cyclobacteriaceae bacterium HetDA_MAG_MS6]